MKIDVVISAKHAEGHKLRQKTVVLVDVLRATTVMCTALYNGAEKIIPVLTTEEVFKTARNIPNAIKAGERHAIKVEDFDFGNSPLDFTPEIVRQKTIVMSTTNGTNALLKTNKAKEVFIGAFVNLSSVAHRLTQSKHEIIILCAGTNGEFSMDDALCAGAIIDRLKQHNTLELSDAALAHVRLFQTQTNLHEALKDSTHYNILKNKGLFKDLKFCLDIDRFDILPEWNGVEVRI